MAVSRCWCNADFMDAMQRCRAEQRAGEGTCISACSPRLLTFADLSLNLCGAGFAVKKHCLGWAVGIQIINQTLIILLTKPSTARLDNTNVKKEISMNHVLYLKSRMNHTVGTKSYTISVCVLRHNTARSSAGAEPGSATGPQRHFPALKSPTCVIYSEHPERDSR